VANPNPELHPENLRPVKPGEVRNPNGSSKKQRLTTALLKLIEEKGLDDPFVRVGMAEALKGDFKFWSYIFDRIDGKMTQKTDLTSNGETLDSPVVILPAKEMHGDGIQAPTGATNEVPGE
jgi:hypothetical protein